MWVKYGLGASALSGHIGEFKPYRSKSFMVACKHMKKNTQVVQSANSSGSIKQLK